MRHLADVSLGSQTSLPREGTVEPEKIPTHTDQLLSALFENWTSSAR